MDARIGHVDDDRRTQAALTARSVIRSYGKERALARVDEMSATREPHSPGNAEFYDLVRDGVREGIETGWIGLLRV